MDIHTNTFYLDSKITHKRLPEDLGEDKKIRTEKNLITYNVNVHLY